MPWLSRSCSLALALAVAAGCGGGDLLPVGGENGNAAPPPETRRTIEIVGLGNPPGEWALRGEIEVEAIVRNDVPAHVDFYVDGGFVNREQRWPYELAGGSYETRQLANGRHTLRAVAVFPDDTELELTQPFLVDNG